MNTSTIFIYSSPAIKPFERLMEEIFITFGLEYSKASDLFYYDVFCKEETYAFFDWSSDPDANCVEIPHKLKNPIETPCAKEAFVHGVIMDVLKGKLQKPEWMMHIESSFLCGDANSPSTFLYILPKKKEYINLAKRITDFLYSVNLVKKII